jgi:hypothetical protein
LPQRIAAPDGWFVFHAYVTSCPVVICSEILILHQRELTLKHARDHVTHLQQNEMTAAAQDNNAMSPKSVGGLLSEGIDLLDRAALTGEIDAHLHGHT